MKGERAAWLLGGPSAGGAHTEDWRAARQFSRPYRCLSPTHAVQMTRRSASVVRPGCQNPKANAPHACLPCCAVCVHDRPARTCTWRSNVLSRCTCVRRSLPPDRSSFLSITRTNDVIGPCHQHHRRHGLVALERSACALVLLGQRSRQGGVRQRVPHEARPHGFHPGGSGHTPRGVRERARHDRWHYGGGRPRQTWREAIFRLDPGVHLRPGAPIPGQVVAHGDTGERCVRVGRHAREEVCRPGPCHLHPDGRPFLRRPARVPAQDPEDH